MNTQESEKRQQTNTTVILKSYLKRKCILAPPVDTDPRILPPKVKNRIVASVALVACTAGFASTIYFPGKYRISKQTIESLNIEIINRTSLCY